MEGIVICDLRFLRDIFETGLLDKVFELPINFHTSDFVYDNIVPEECAKKCKTLRENGTFVVDTIPGKEFENILECRKRGLSFDDATAWYIARKFGLGLLTDDFVLKRHLVEDSKKVIGILDILDMLVSNSLISVDRKEEALSELRKLGREF
ncbi:MAG: hypothetical protein MJZ16_06190 [Bacteroidales bacterium]|nr:hypothetical protein [Bacteroidales bacterium]